MLNRLLPVEEPEALLVITAVRLEITSRDVVPTQRTETETDTDTDTETAAQQSNSTAQNSTEQHSTEEMNQRLATCSVTAPCASLRFAPLFVC